MEWASERGVDFVGVKVMRRFNGRGERDTVWGARHAGTWSFNGYRLSLGRDPPYDNPLPSCGACGIRIDTGLRIPGVSTAIDGTAIFLSGAQ